MTPALWRAARTDGRGAALEDESGREAFLRDLSVLMEGDVARRAARERLEGAGVVLAFFLLWHSCWIELPVF